jgi:uncharacterized protein YdhG (YjbR/CyaY superfamily)
MLRKPQTIDEYLSRVHGSQRAALEVLRAMLHALVPDAEECIRYNLPAFEIDGEVVAGFAATAKGCSYYPFSGTTLAALGSKLDGYKGTKSALHFDPEHPLPRSLVSLLVRARRAELSSSTKRSSK